MSDVQELPAQLHFGWDQKDPAKSSETTATRKSAKKKAMKKKSAKTNKKSASAATTKKAGRKKKTTTRKASAKATAKVKKPATRKATKKVSGKKKSAARKKPLARKKSVAKKHPVAAQASSAEVATVNLAETTECIDLKWGASLPTVGLGFWKIEKEKTAAVCREAIEIGYRHLDCACDYGNEVEVGQGIAAALKSGVCERDDLWVTSKLWNTYHEPKRVRQACERSLKDLGLEYLDLYLIHFPLAQRFVPFEKRYPPGWFFEPDVPNPVVEEARVSLQDTWRAMEELAKSGLVRNIGLCNVGTSQLRDLLAYAKIRPAVLQVETHPYLTQEKLLQYCQQERIAYTAFSPLGAQSYFSLGMAEPSEAVLQHKTVTKIARETQRTPAQVLLRWGVQRGTAVIPKTSSRARLIENLSVFDFSLSDKQMKALSSLDKGRRFNDPGDFGSAAFNTFLPIYE